MLRSPETTPLRCGAAHGPLHPALCSSPKLQSFLFLSCSPLCRKLSVRWVCRFFGEEMLMFWFWCPSGFGPQIVWSWCLLLLPCFPLPWGGVHRRDDFLFSMTMIRTTDVRRGECCAGAFDVLLFVFRLLGGLWPPQRLEPDEIILPRHCK